MSGNCKQLSLLLWKNWILKKRTLCSSVVEIVVPVIFLSFLVLIRGAVSVDEVDESLNLGYATTVSDQYPWFIATLACGGALNGPSRSFNQSVAFSPDSGVDYNIIQDLANDVRAAFLPPAAFLGTFLCTTDDGLSVPVNATEFVSQRMFRTFESTDALNDYYEDENYGTDDAHSPLFMGINIGATSPNWAYTIRVNISDTPWTGILINNLLVGFDSDIWTTYIRNGVLSIEFLVNQYILEHQVGTTAPLDATFIPFPNPNYKQDNFQAYVGDIFGLFLVFGFMYPFSRLVRNLVEEKEKKIKEGMKMMGLRNWTFWVSWSITYLLIFLITMIAFLGISKSSLFKYSEFGILFVFFLGFALSMVALGCLLTSFFSKAKSAGTLSPFALMLGYLPYFAVSSSTGSTGNKNAACLLSPVALSLGSNNILAWESAFQGARAENASEVVNNFALGTAIGMLYFDTVFYFILAWYLDKVWPSEYGTQLPWYFLFTKRYWVSCLPARDGAEREERPLLAAEMKTFNESVDFGPNYEPVSQKLAEATGVSIRGLRKEFPGEDGQPFVSVHGLNLDMYKGQVFVLLGHNGAGKTTTINMLTGMLPPTSGSAGVFGVDIVDDMDKIRSMMGVCPQHDTLFDSLTVKEHLEFFGGLKGMTGQVLADEVKLAIEEVQLEEKINAEARTLSGGQKRRLSLAIALIGDSKVVFLDEPTSGVDPHSRRAIWDLLTKKKQNRVIVLTTHFMDEADQLGDRIGILHKGKMKCCGSSLFLKRKYGVGYVMTLNKTPACDGHKVTELVKSHVPQAERLSEVGTELVYRLPLASASEFPTLLNELDQKKTALGLNNYGLSVTTLEEVFLKVANDASASVEEKKDTSELIRSISERRGSGGEKHASEIDKKLEGSVRNKTFGRHFSALLVKRFHIAKRDRKAQCCQFLLPLIMIAAGLGLLHIPPDTQFPTVDFSALNEYNQPLPMPYTSNMPTPLVSNLQPSNPIPITATDYSNVSYYLLDTRDSYKESRYAAYYQDAGVNGSAPYDNYNMTIFSNVTAWHGLPTFLNLGFASILRTLKNDPSANIYVKNHPFSWTWKEKETIQNVNGIFAAIVISMGMVFIPASMGTFIVKEREVKARHLQNISGVGIIAYWTSNFLWDFVCFLIPAFLAALIVLAYDNPVFVGANFGALFLSFILYGLSVIPFTYVLSFFFKSSSTAQNVMIMIYLFAGIGMTMANFALYIIPSTTEANSKYIRHLFRLLPNFCLGDSVFYLGIRSFLDLDRYHLDVTGYDYIFMAVEAIVYFSMTLIIDRVASMPNFMSRFRGDPDVPLDERQLDQDVYQEMSRLKAGQAEDDLIRVEGLRKVYHPRKVAARDVWFGIPSGQCFGFLGVNGAGKTTTLKMLTGDEIPSTGRAHLGGFDISEESEEVRKIMGYCPQFDAIFELLTAKETLEFYGRIRGIPEEKLPDMVDALIQRLSLTDYRDRAAGKYSGGNKRKLSVAIALIGNPKVVFLDEPSTGMDPVSRRFMWDFISETMTTRAVILTTHSMEECEALCDRIGIFVNGQLECLGSSQHLKTRFGRGLQIDISTADRDVEGAKAFIQRFFPGAQEIECYGNNLKYKIETKNSLADIFKLIESNKEKVGISDYSVGQTTLEQIFINFAKMGEVQLAAAASSGGVVMGVTEGIPDVSGSGRSPVAYTKDLPDKKDEYMPRSDSDIELASSPEHHQSSRRTSKSSSRNSST